MKVTRAARLLAVMGATVAVFSSTGAATAHAAENGSWAVFPTSNPAATQRPFFDEVVPPGTSVRDAVTVTNKTQSQLTFNLYAADAFNTKNGIFSLRRRIDPQRDVGSWIQLPVHQVTLKAGEALAIPFTMNVPANVEPGDHGGGIVLEATQPSAEQRSQVGVGVLQAVGTRVYVRVQGPLQPSLAITRMSMHVHQSIGARFGGPVDADVDYTVVNTGNVRLSSSAATEVHGLVGGSKTLANLSIPELLPGGSATVRQRARGAVPLGRLTARVKLTAADAGTTGQTSMWVVPWFSLTIVVVLAGLVIWRRRRPDTRPSGRGRRGGRGPQAGRRRLARGRSRSSRQEATFV